MRRPPWNRSLETISSTAGGAAVSPEESAGYVQHRIDVELTLVFPDVVEGDVLSMSYQPGGLMIQGCVSLLKGTHPEDYRDTAAL
jgi:hypothetical protein